MNDWKIIDVIDDLESGDGARMLIVYSVSTKYAHDGVYSASIPKDHFNMIAAAFGYDIDDEEDRQDLFDHVVHQGFMHAVKSKRGDSPALSEHPKRVGKRQAKQAVRTHLEEFRKTGFPVEADTGEIAAKGFKAARAGSLMGKLKAEMEQILDPVRVRDYEGLLDPAVDSAMVANEMMKRRQRDQS